MRPVWDDPLARPVDDDVPRCEICGSPLALDGVCENENCTEEVS